MGNSTLWIDISFYVFYVLFGIAVLGSLFSAIKGFAGKPGGLKMALLGMVGIVAVFAVSWILSSGTDVSEILFEKTGTSLWWSRPVSAALYSFYILFICTVLIVIGTELLRPSKR
jgi:H+/Cl- antiporter ClcA